MGGLVARAHERESRMTEAAGTDERGLGLSDFDRFPGVESYGKWEPLDLYAVFRKDAPETFLRGCCDCLIETVPVWAHVSAERQPIEGMRICPPCGRSFHPTRSDHVYCSDSCQRKGSRLGKEAIAHRMENDRLMRRCEAPGCDRSLIGLTARAKYCSTKHRVKAAYHRRV
jgi:hypothetical protein